MDKTYFLNDKLYNILKWVALVVFPALATFVGVVFPVWGVGNVDAIVTTLNAIGLLIGALIGVSQATVKPVEPEEDATDDAK